MGSRSKIIIGITGVIGSGKSEMCRFLEKHHGFYWIEADKIVRQLYEAGQPGYKKIKEYFGKSFVGKYRVHRGRLRSFILQSQQKLWILNKMIHPLVVHEVSKKIAQYARSEAKHVLKQKDLHQQVKPLRICIEALYFEQTDLGKFIDMLFIIDAKDAIIFKRLKKRKIPKAQLEKLLTFQRKVLIPRGLSVIQNNQGLVEFQDDLLKLLQPLLHAFGASNLQQCQD